MHFAKKRPSGLFFCDAQYMHGFKGAKGFAINRITDEPIDRSGFAPPGIALWVRYRLLEYGLKAINCRLLQLTD
ncbi:MAG: hypothetical protein EA359_06730 [Balneolaceae bacterium]|nr:MAG: hypothetical protein EA359_06730 [Balneolaceae bacterium]